METNDTTAKKLPQDRRLTYRPGDLIIKEGDYGISVYRIKGGRVRVLKEYSSAPRVLAELAEGEIFGEMAFIDGGTSPRTTSVKAEREVEVEVWHPLSLKEEYRTASRIIRILASQMVRRLARIDAVYDRLRLETEAKNSEQKSAPRKEYRKKWVARVSYRLTYDASQTLRGTIKEIGVKGMRMEVPETNVSYFEHSGDLLYELFFKIPEAGAIMVKGKIISSANGERPGFYSYEVEFKEMDSYMRRKLTLFVTG